MTPSPCPRCKTFGKVVTLPNSDCGDFVTACQNCDGPAQLFGYGDTVDESIADWNNECGGYDPRNEVLR